ncbi:FIG00930276: hypothetical protein [hydrothermal vent metagenome]|uniref:VWFA domain-containing protein n=1 Tax=hydrothermal vent metagenome TaxID=652676 RepID=A0A3B0SZH4_9ZZZZ
METKTVLYIIIAAIVALILVLFQYYFKTKRRGRLSVLLSFLRFLGLFGFFLLIINPKFSKNDYSVEKVNLVVLTDNSSSMEETKNEVASFLSKIEGNADISKRFNLEKYTFGTALEELDSLSFDEKNTNISKALASLSDVYSNSNTAIVMLTDGNQTVGEDYGYYGSQLKFSVYAIAVGDTTQYEDVRIGQVNSNKYAFLKNKFPLEAYVSYTGNDNIVAMVSVSVNEKNVYRENVRLSKENNSRAINTLIDANSVGVKNIKVSVSTLSKERNTLNNQRNVVVEVIDEKTNIAIISSIVHPDIGALKKAIESNEQRTVSILRPTVNSKNFEEVDVFILYQPSPSFKSVYTYLQQKKASVFTITGEVVNSSFLNEIQNTYKINGSYPIQETFPILNPSFSKFDISDFSIDGFPPLSSKAGVSEYENGEALLTMMVMAVTIDSPLLFAVEGENGKELVLFGENIWKWRMQSYRNDRSFENFDGFMGKLMRYLSANKSKDRLNIEYKSIYQGSNDAKITATYFDETFVFDSNAVLTVELKNTKIGSTKQIPMLLKNNFYEADFSDLPPGTYSFKVRVKDDNRTKSGSFTILDFDVERQFLSTDYKKLGQLAEATQGGLYFQSNADSLLQDLLENNRFVPTQKSTKNIVSLIDFRLLLAIIIAALSAEWFIRKYNGLT